MGLAGVFTLAGGVEPSITDSVRPVRAFAVQLCLAGVLSDHRVHISA